jgi:hypothetical protein
MALQLGALRDALLAAGAPEDKARAAAEEAAGYETRLARMDAKLSVALWAGGLSFAAILASQAVLWVQVGKIDGQLSSIAAQATHIEQLLTHR